MSQLCYFTGPRLCTSSKTVKSISAPLILVRMPCTRRFTIGKHMEFTRTLVFHLAVSCISSPLHGVFLFLLLFHHVFAVAPCGTFIFFHYFPFVTISVDRT